MFQFVFIGVFATLLIFLSRDKRASWLSLIAYALIVYVASMQDSISMDFAAYVRLFDKIATNERVGAFFSLSSRSGTVELGWYLLNYYLGKFVYSYHFVALVATCIICFAIHVSLASFNSRWKWLSIFVFYFIYMPFFMSGIRQGVAISFFIIATVLYVKRHYLLCVTALFLGLLFHNSIVFSLVAFPLLSINDSYLERKKISIVKYIGCFYVLFLLFSSQIQLFLIDYLMPYFESNAASYSFYIGEIANVRFTFFNVLYRMINFSFLLLAFYHSKAILRQFLLLGIFSECLLLILGESGAMSRLAYYYTIFMVPCVALVPECIRKKYIAYLFVVLTLLFTFHRFSSSLDSYLYKKFHEYHTIII